MAFTNFTALQELAVENAELLKAGKHVPRFSSGARSYIRVGGKALGVAQDFRWQVVAQASEIRTIDTNLPWDISPGQILITAVLNQIVDPTNALEAQGLFHTMQSMVHQPYVELQVLDFNGLSQFFARGMFLSVAGQIARGQLTSVSANFQGVLYQHNVFQEFTPYSEFGDLVEGIEDAFGALSDLTGGFL